MRVLSIGSGFSTPASVHHDDPCLAVEHLGLEEFDVAVVGGLAAAEALLQDLLAQDRQLPVVCLIEAESPGELLDRASRLLRLGAARVLPKAIGAAELEREIVLAARTREVKPVEAWRKTLVGSGPAMSKIAELIRLVGPRRATVLITGESGTGKEMAARALHLASTRAAMPFVAINCNAIPRELLEAELFGHVKGAFTGASQDRVGRFEQAQSGTLFLDEIGDLPLDLQTKLLRVLQEREFERVGSSRTMKSDVRVIAATNADLPARIRDGRFREDLYYRLNVVPLEMPPLRDRPEDLALLVGHLVGKICQMEGLPARAVSRETLAHLAEYSWPGNVRQLENAVEMAIAFSGERSLLMPADFPLPLPARLRPTEVPGQGPIRMQVPAIPREGIDFERLVGSFELGLLEQALRRTGGNKKQAADILRLKRTTMNAKLKMLTVA